MPGKVVSGSPNIAFLDSKLIADLCEGIFLFDATVSTFIGAGASNVLGVKVKITNPYNVVIKDYSGAYDIADPDTDDYEFDIPTQGGKYQYGVYTISIQLTDADSTTHEVTKTINVCKEPDAQSHCEDAVQLIADCLAGTLTVLVSEPLVYQGKMAESKTASWTIIYPSGTLPNFTTTLLNFAVQLFEGVYKVTGSHCATYNLGDNVFVRLGYTGKWENNAKCVLDYSCISPKLTALHKKLDSHCSAKEKAETTNTILEVLWLIKYIEILTSNGEDAGDQIAELEKILGCPCTCQCDASAPIINNSASTLIQIDGCGVVKTQAGLTTHYLINNYEYKIDVDPNQAYLTVGPATTNGCVKTQRISMPMAMLYAAVVSQVSGNTQNNFWAGVINNTLANVDPTCLGVTQEQWNALSLYQKWQLTLNRACEPGDCDAVIDTTNTARTGNGVTVSWTATDTYGVDVFLDGILKARVLSPVASYLIPTSTDGLLHNYILIPFCSTGLYGTPTDSTFQYNNCPSISPPNVTSSNVSGATCPYDLTALQTGVPIGITIEWHNQNNTDASSLVGNPATVSSGVYFAFAKNIDGCYSTGTQVTLSCASGSCTAPQTLLVSIFTGGFLVTFESAAYPPPLDSYTVKRRLASAPDISGSYTTLGSPTWNAGTSRWEILDTTGVNNTLYVYRAQSNCGGTTPYTDYQFARITCPLVSLAPTDTTMPYSFTHLGGGVDKYDVKIYNSTGTTLIDTETHLPAFPSPITGEFIYLEPDTQYRIRVRVYIGDYFQDCSFSIGQTTSSGPVTVNWSFGEFGSAQGSLAIDKNGINQVTATAVNSGNFTAADGDLIEVSVIGTMDTERYLYVEKTTGGIILLDTNASPTDISYSFNVIASNTYDIDGFVDDVGGGL